MKIDRVLFCLNNNELYTGFWNKVSEVWYKAYNATPTLLFNGSNNELKSLNLSNKYGDIVVIPTSDSVKVQSKRNWTVTWSLFYGATLFPEEVCTTSGIDQIPLGNHIIDNIHNLDNESYVVCFYDAYKQPNLFPSAYHIAKGKYFKEIYQIDNDWNKEILKVATTKNKYPHVEYDGWGLDEGYSSDILVSSKKPITFWKGFFHNVWVTKRLDRSYNMNYDIDLLQSGWYSELHSPRPYEEYKDYINTVIYDRYGF